MVIVVTEGFTKAQGRNKVAQDRSNMREAVRARNSLRVAQVKLTPTLTAGTGTSPVVQTKLERPILVVAILHGCRCR